MWTCITALVLGVSALTVLSGVPVLRVPCLALCVIIWWLLLDRVEQVRRRGPVVYGLYLICSIVILLGVLWELGSLLGQTLLFLLLSSM